MTKYFVTEPSPSTTSYIRCGRGGAGNTFRAPTVSSSTPVVAPHAPSSSTRRFFSGIGGAGNSHNSSERPVSLDDAVNHAAARDNASVGYCGRGGAGNVFRRESDASTVSSGGSSVRSSMSSRSKLWDRVSSLAR